MKETRKVLCTGCGSELTSALYPLEKACAYFLVNGVKYRTFSVLATEFIPEHWYDIKANFKQDTKRITHISILADAGREVNFL